MRKLFLFLARYSVVFLFLMLEIISLAVYVNNERFAKSIFFSSSNQIISGLYSVSNSVIEFFKLRPANESLSEENAYLKNRVLDLENQLAIVNKDSAIKVSFNTPPEKDYRFISAKIINNSTNKSRNFITLNKGAVDGIRPDMGVVSPEGLVGIIKTTSNKFSVAISVLNPMIQISSKIKRNDYTGPLTWDGKDAHYVKLLDIPRHVVLQIGDTIVTSGLTTTFPEGIPIGIIEDFSIEDGDAFFNIKVKLAVDFRSVSQVNIIDYRNYKEQKELEKESK